MHGKRIDLDRFKLVSPYSPAGDQPAAIRSLTDRFRAGVNSQCLLGVTGSGKTFTMANVVAELNRRFPMEECGERYFTIVYGVLDLESGEFRYASAGHPAVVVLRPGQAPEAIEVAALSPLDVVVDT